jgi:hypothetical protein
MSDILKAKPKQSVDMESTKERVRMALKKEEEPQPRFGSCFPFIGYQSILKGLCHEMNTIFFNDL